VPQRRAEERRRAEEARKQEEESAKRKREEEKEVRADGGVHTCLWEFTLLDLCRHRKYQGISRLLATLVGGGLAMCVEAS
jgi:hypothetical protein